MLKILLLVLSVFVAIPTVFAAEESISREDLLKKDLTNSTDREKEQVFSVLAPNLFSKRVNPPEGTVNCFDDYRFGSVQVNLSPVLEQTIPGVPFTFAGTLKNENDYPLVNGSVYVKIFKKEGGDGSVQMNGYPMVDFFEVGKDIMLPANGVKNFSFEWLVPTNLAGGDYEADFFFVTDQRFNLLGLPFTDDITGNKASFHITGEEGTQIFFDKNTVTLNGGQYLFADLPPHFGRDEAVISEITIVNPTNFQREVSLSWELYNWDGIRQENRLDMKDEKVVLERGERKKVSYASTQHTGAVSYLLIRLQDADASSVMNIRFVRDNIEEARLNFASLKNFPLNKNEKAEIFSCLHTTNVLLIDDAELVMDLRDENGDIIHSYSYQGGVTGNMVGVRDAFIPKKGYGFLTLSTTLRRNGEIIESLDTTYDCQKIDPSLCMKSSVVSTSQKFSLKHGLILLTTLLFIGGLGLYLVRRVSREAN